MTSSSNNNLSLYQLIKNCDPSPNSVGINLHTLQSYIETVTNTFIEHSTDITVILKAPQSQNGAEIVKKYQNNERLKSFYLCGDFSDASSKSLAEATLSSNKTIPIVFGKDNRLKRECFLLILTPELCGLIIAQWQKGQITIDTSGKRLQKPYLETIVTFEPTLIETFFDELKIAIAVSNPDIENFGSNSDFKGYFSNSQTKLQTKLLTSLLLQQIATEEQLRATKGKQANAIATEENSLASNIGLHADFLRNLVEEMRSPITYMKTTIGLLASKQIKGEQRQRYLKMLETQCDRQNSVISGLIELLQLDSFTKADTIYLNEFVPGIVSTYQPLANENNIQLGYTIPANLPPVFFPASWLRQIIIQLLNNSLQFTPPKGKVYVQAGLKGLNVELTIGDTGRGIDDRELNKIFDSFYRTKTISNDSSAGAGLGLTIVRQLIEKSGGEISVTSKIGKGSNFKILLPALPAELV